MSHRGDGDKPDVPGKLSHRKPKKQNAIQRELNGPHRSSAIIIGICIVLGAALIVLLTLGGASFGG